ncbi:ABC transporter ATP-binding protein [Paenibacillus sp. Marseille-Q4541]|uniref:ABC transporter ATP-binding protein n=1 Tax=Paenibacillus sp. Marseille-Q4541 TaxID=2831522 RepID=UPI001BAA0479|nr:ABC transporter ATP-binding protein [Paenibacillus sp. Marseille-Q4541]
MKQYGSRVILRDVSLSIPKGQIYGFIGPSGAGKTTLVKMMVGMDTPDAGQLYVLGEQMPNMSVLSKIGYMAQSDALYPELSGLENIQFFTELYSLSKARQKERIAYAAELVGLSSDLQRKVSTYSGGMKRRLSLAISLVHDPEILILDEPTVGIDPKLRQIIWQELIRLKDEKQKTIIVTTHVMDEAQRCDCLAMVREGQILAEGAPDALKTSYQVETLEEIFLQTGGVHDENV